MIFEFAHSVYNFVDMKYDISISQDFTTLKIGQILHHQ